MKPVPKKEGPSDRPPHGYVVRIDARAIGVAAASARGGAEVVLRAAVGSFVGFRDELAEVRLNAGGDADGLARAVRRAIVLERQRDLDHDPAFGIEQLHTIAWTSISTVKSNPYPGLLVIRSLRDLLARWSDEGASGADGRATPVDTSPVVYADDVPGRVMDVEDHERLAHDRTPRLERPAAKFRLRGFCGYCGTRRVSAPFWPSQRELKPGSLLGTEKFVR